MEHFRIDYADIFIDDQGEGRGKIIIADSYNDYNFSYFWGAMGNKSMVEFLIGTSGCYFSGKLCGTRYDRQVIDMKATLTNIRRAIREEFKWFEYMPFQKELREKLKDFDCESIADFYDRISDLPDRLYYDEVPYKEEAAVKRRLESCFEDASYLIATKDSPAIKYLEILHEKLKAHLKTR